MRCLLPLQANGWEGDKISYVKQFPSEIIQDMAKESEIVVFHRPDEPKKLKIARILKKAGKKIVFDNVDTFKDDGGFKFNEFMNKERMERGLATINETLDTFIKEADLVTCSTEFLKKEYEKLNSNVVVLPNCIDPFYFDEPIKNDTDKIRIGITGSVAITSDMDVLKPILDKYQNDDRVQIVLFSMPPQKNDKITRELYFDEYAYWESIKNLEWQPFVPMEKYYETLNELKLDIMLIPRAETYFNKCKSNLKFLEASMFKIPTIAQGFSTGDSPYEQNPEDQKHLLLAKNTDEFIEKIELLINDKALREKIGEDAYNYVVENYDINKKVHLWEKAYQSILK